MAEKTTSFTPGSFGCHEALHMASVLAEMVDERLCQHPAIALKPEWRAKADAAREALFDLYQAIGGEHLRRRNPARGRAKEGTER